MSSSSDIKDTLGTAEELAEKMDSTKIYVENYDFRKQENQKKKQETEEVLDVSAE